MTANNTVLAIFLGSKSSPKMTAWMAMPEATRQANEKEGIAAWKAWVKRHEAAIVTLGGPLGKTKKVSANGIEDISNSLGAFSVVKADSHEVAAKLFENHPHFTIFRASRSRLCPCFQFPDRRSASPSRLRSPRQSITSGAPARRRPTS
jgi:hypothetical protein